MSDLGRNFSIFLVLVRRDCKLLSSNIFSLALDCLPALFVQVVTFGYLFPLFGMPSSMIAPSYLGSMLGLFLQLGFTLTMKIGFDLEHNRFIDYQMMLPISRGWLFAAYTINNMIEIAVITIPLLTIGVILLHKFFIIASINWFVVAFMYALILIFFSTFFLAIGYTFNITWILDNVWPRILTPLWWVSGALMMWKKVHAWSPSIAYAMLASPMTYVAEGIRSAFIDNDQFIAWYICALVLMTCISINCVCFMYGMKKRLDPV